jgi:hypothetical protein
MIKAKTNPTRHKITNGSVNLRASKVGIYLEGMPLELSTTPLNSTNRSNKKLDITRSDLT